MGAAEQTQVRAGREEESRGSLRGGRGDLKASAVRWSELCVGQACFAEWHRTYWKQSGYIRTPVGRPLQEFGEVIESNKRRNGEERTDGRDSGEAVWPLSEKKACPRLQGSGPGLEGNSGSSDRSDVTRFQSKGKSVSP